MPDVYRPEAEALIWDEILDRLAGGATLASQLFEVQEDYGRPLRDKIETRIVSVLLAHAGDRWPLRREADTEIGPRRLIPVRDDAS